MQRRPFFWYLVSLMGLAGAIYFWHLGEKWKAEQAETASRAEAAKTNAVPAQPVPQAKASAAPDARYPYRLSNSTRTQTELAHDDKAILLANALIDTVLPVNLDIPSRLRAPKENGIYIVQARGAAGAAFRAKLSAAGATIVSYIPNNSFLVRLSEDGAQQLSADQQLVQSVLPYEPYYKLDPSLLKLAVKEQDLPADVALSVTLFPEAREATLTALKQLGADVVAEQRSPFGPVLVVHPAKNTFVDVTRLPGVQVVAPAHSRQTANDLTRTRLGISVNTLTDANYLGLTGSNVLININDSGADTNHPDLAGRVTVFGGFTGDPNGHGTHVAGTILGNGSKSSTVTTASGSTIPGANFRGMAPGATGFVIPIGIGPRFGAVNGDPGSDIFIQEVAALSNAVISANAWIYSGASGYDIAAASYDAAVRDALPETPGSQPLLMVFPAGNSGGGNEVGSSGNPGTVLSPGTAKNVITVGAIEQFRNITNNVILNGVTNQDFLGGTDSSNQVTSFSSRGNAGIGIEGDSGRFKPDLVAPGTFVLSDKSSDWDMAAYYNPTNFHTDTSFNQVVDTNLLAAYSIFVPPNAVELDIQVFTNNLSPTPFPANMPIYVKFNDNPTTNNGGFDILGTNFVAILANAGSKPLTPDSVVFYSVGNPTNELINFDIQTTLVTTNDDGNRLTVLSNLNSSLGPFYRYESGTSMSAASVSGMLALMEEFFQKQLQLTNPSPALMKALLINGARPVSGQYDLQVANGINYQGWGLPVLSNSIPGVLTNLSNGSTNIAFRFFDQDPTNALATGQSKTRTLNFQANATALPLRVTLVWTDPPGNPAAGIKLVNDLDLIVTNLDNGQVFYGNDIPGGSDFNETSPTNGPPRNDVVNNVENVYLPAPLSTNYSVTVYARRVNVNAITLNTNNIVQDYALVIASGDGGAASNSFTLNDTAIVSSNVTTLVTITNGIPLLRQRVGGNPQYASSTNGITNQWNFYVFTNTAAATNGNFTNVAFVTFFPPNLGLPRGGTFGEVAPPDTNATRFAGADIDLYVSTNPDLTNLNPAVINGAFKSVGRTGTEKVLFTNSSANQVYYIGVKSEDQQGAEFGFVAVATDQPFGQRDPNGNIILTVISPPLPADIPTGSPHLPGTVSVLALTTESALVRKVVVQDTITHQEFGDLVGSFGHDQKFVVLNNHSFFDNGTSTETFSYDDSGEVDTNFPSTRHTDGPGTLQTFSGDQATEGIWVLTMVNDSSLVDTGQINNLRAVLEPQIQANGFTNTIAGNSFFFDFIDVPPGATNLTVTIGLTSGNAAPVDVFLRRGAFPTRTTFDKSTLINPPGGTLTIGQFDSPPLNPGRYFVGVFNPNPTPVTVSALWTIGLSLTGVQPVNFLSIGNEPILDDAITYSLNHVGINSRVVSAEVGVRIDHPRESDLVLTLISPQGTRVLLAENRGGLDTNGYGSGVNTTNVLPQTTNGGFAGNTNIINTPTNAGTLLINFNFETVPDDMRIYYDGARIFDSGLVSGSGTFSINFGPGASSSVSIVMNEGNNSDTNTVWTYAVTEISQTATYATFTDDTNKTIIPIKFAVPPFGTNVTSLPAVTNQISDFEASPSGDYVFPAIVDGWTVVDTNPVKVVTVTALANTGTNVLALHKGTISRTLPTIAGRTYTLTFASHGHPPATGPVSWWKGEGNFNDSTDGNNGTANGGITFTNGVVGQAFNVTGPNSQILVADAPNLALTNSITIEGWISYAPGPNPLTILARNDGGASSIQPYGMTVGQIGGVSNNLTFDVRSDAAGVPGTEAFVSTPLAPNTLVHAAGTYRFNGANATMVLYTNGVVASQALTPVRPVGILSNGTPGFGIGNVGNLNFNAPWNGLLDEITLYSNVLSRLQVQDVYAAGSAGKSASPSIARVVLAGVTNATIFSPDAWTPRSFTFTAPSNGTFLQIQAFSAATQGTLLDSFNLVELPGENPTNNFQPEESLAKLVGEKSQGDWALEVVDNRAGATNPTPNLVSWQLSLVLEATGPAVIPLTHAIPNTNTVAANSISYYSVDVPPWAQFATNILVTASGPVNLLFNQSGLPGTNAADVTLLTGATTGTATLTTIGSPPLIPGARYFLGVQNLGAAPVNFTIEVDFDITTLTNAIPRTNDVLAATTVPRYYQYDVSTNAQAVAFELFNLNGNVDLVVRRGPPLPDETTFDYLSANTGTNNETIVVVTNSTPVALTPGRWYLGVFNADTNPVTYTIEAIESGPPLIIPLTNGVPFTTNVPPGPALNLFYSFNITNAPSAALFELYALNGNVDLTLDSNSLPYTPPFFGVSPNPGTNREQIVIRTNTIPNLNGNWFLGVPNNDSTNVTYTIRAIMATNGMLISGVPITTGVTLPGLGSTNGPTLSWPSVPGEMYVVEETTTLTPANWIPVSTNTAPGATTTFTDPIPITGSPVRFYRIVQIPVP